MIVHALEARDAAQIAFRDATFDVHHLAAIEDLAGLDLEDRLDRIAVCALRLAHRLADRDRLGRRAVDAPLLHFRAGARRLAGRRGRAILDDDLAADPLGPLPARHLVDDGLEPT